MTTTPVEPTVTQTVSLSSVDELLNQARRLGLTWDLRAATVAETTGSYTPYVPRVVPDGDTDDSRGIIATSFVGGVAPTMRVMVMYVPPAGAYIVSTFDPTQVQRYEIGSRTSHSTSMTTTETVMETFRNFTVLPGAAYRIEIGGWLLAASGTFTIFRIRNTSTAGQSLNATAFINGIGLAQAPLTYFGYFVNRTDAPIITNLVLTGVTNTASSTWGADSERPRYVSIQYAGPAVEYPSAVGIT